MKNKCKEAVSGMTMVAVGQVQPEVIGMPEGIEVHMNDFGGITVNVFFNKIKNREVQQFRSESSFELKLLRLNGVFFLLLKFGTMKWMDTLCKVPENIEHLEVPEEGKGLAMKVYLYDTHTGKLCAARLISLSTEISREAINMVKEQAEFPLSKKEIYANIARIYALYSTKELVKMVPHKHSFKIY